MTEVHRRGGQACRVHRRLGAQTAMLGYMKRTDEIGDLPLYDGPTYERTLEAGRFGDRPRPAGARPEK
jgi:hypothetical protein